MYSSTCLNYNYMELVGYETGDKLIWTSGEGFKNTNTIIKQGIPRSNIKKKSPSSTLAFGCYPHDYTWDILS